MERDVNLHIDLFAKVLVYGDIVTEFRHDTSLSLKVRARRKPESRSWLGSLIIHRFLDGVGDVTSCMAPLITTFDLDPKPGFLTTALVHMDNLAGVDRASVTIAVAAEGVDGVAQGLSDGGFAAIVDLGLAEVDFGPPSCARLNGISGHVGYLHSELVLIQVE